MGPQRGLLLNGYSPLERVHVATIKELQREIAELRTMLAQVIGLPPVQEPSDPTLRPDFIEFGSSEHAVFLGLVPIDSTEEAEERAVYQSPRTKRLYCLDDEIAAVRFFPGVDPDKAILLLLRQKVNVFESGSPQVPENAPAMWEPTPNPLMGI